MPKAAAKKVARKGAARKKRARSSAAPSSPPAEASASPDRSRQIAQSLEGMQVRLEALSALKPYRRNARTHSEAQIAQIARSIQEFGWMNPVLIDERGQILAGHGRYEAARSLGLEAIPVVEHRHLTKTQKRQYVLADNRLAELAGWDPALLGEELGALRDLGADLGIIGWTPDEVASAIAAAGATRRGRTGPDDAPPLEDTAVSEEGELWVLGPHRLIVGDCTSRDVVMSLLEGRRAPHMMVTDPPYGVSYDPAWRERSGLAKDGAVTKGKLRNDDRVDWTEAWSLFPGDVAYVWHAGTKAHIVSGSLEVAGFEIRSQIVWVKPRFVISRGAYHVQHEPAFYAVRRDADDDRWQEPPDGSQPDSAEGLDAFDRFSRDHELMAYSVRKGATAGWVGGRKQSTVWNIAHLRNDQGHPTQKPIEAMQRPVENNSKPGDAVYDPFVGSGTTLIACERTGRACYAVELDPRYADVVIRRWQEFTGKEAVLESRGITFAERREERA